MKVGDVLQVFIEMMIESGKTGVDLSLYLILPMMVIMMAIMKVFDEKGFLSWLAVLFSPALIVFGLPGIGILALLQILFISFAAPVAILRIMDQDPSVSDAKIAATFSAILVMSQANASFPLAAVGLHLPVTIITSIIFGLLASLMAFTMCKKLGLDRTTLSDQTMTLKKDDKKQSLITLLFKGGEEGLQIVLKTIPALIIAIFLVNLFTFWGVVDVLEDVMTPFLVTIGIPGIAVLPIVTKFMAGGTAMMAILLDLMNSGMLSEAELNRIAGFTLHPLDPVGLAIFMAAGQRVASVVRPALIAAIVGIILKGIAHLVIF